MSSIISIFFSVGKGGQICDEYSTLVANKCLLVVLPPSLYCSLSAFKFCRFCGFCKDVFELYISGPKLRVVIIVKWDWPEMAKKAKKNDP